MEIQWNLVLLTAESQSYGYDVVFNELTINDQPLVTSQMMVAMKAP
jgi:hypothetical protein